MSSTRNKNQPENYNLEIFSKQKQMKYKLYENGSNSKAYTTHLPGNGLLTGRIASSSLSENYCDVESFLYGIGSTNLVNRKEKVVGNLYEMDNLNIINRPPMIIDRPFVQEMNQRPLFE
jgi:hypothetical protein